MKAELMNQKPNPIKRTKVVLLGDQGVGKSSIITRFVKNEFNSAHYPTIGIDFLSKCVETANKKTLRLQLWDTAGQERFRSLIPGYLKDCTASLIVFDVTSQTSFEAIHSWVDLVREVRGEQSKIYLIANKIDMQQDRTVAKQKIQEMVAGNLKYKYYEVSAKEGTGVNQAFVEMCNELSNLDNSSVLAVKTKNLGKITIQDPKSKKQDTKSGLCAC